ncbi:hypothetical protein C0992_002617 [Termitomyces sp. T32_za158]|nr:hypothetical protein C0992_002617 [Termitomyces sp. T32_za158]
MDPNVGQLWKRTLAHGTMPVIGTAINITQPEAAMTTEAGGAQTTTGTGLKANLYIISNPIFGLIQLLRDIRKIVLSVANGYKRVLEQVWDPEMQRKLVPNEQPHPIGAKHISLEQSYYKVFNQPNIILVDLNKNPIVEVTSKDVKTQDGVVHELDVLMLATSFDALMGSISQIKIKGMDGTSIGDK